MQKYQFVVLTNPEPGQEKVYNEWYNNQHIPDVLNLPGVVAAQRFKLSDTQRAEPPYPWSYLAIYEVETDNLDETIAALKSRGGTPAMPMTKALSAERLAWFFQPITERVTAD
jgi:hypothetical protein